MNNLRERFILSICILALIILVITELLSFYNLIDSKIIKITWITITILLIIKVGYYVKENKKNIKEKIKLNFNKLNSQGYLYFYLSYILIVILITAILAWYSPPNTFDSMTYHMSRVMHWIQNRNVDFYPTSILRQLFSSPWSEYAILHLQLLSNSDRYANYVQWLSMVSSLIGVSLIAKQLGASIKGQIYAAVMCTAIPMGILQSTSTQTDYVVALWIICFVHFCLRINIKIDLISTLGAGVSLGLALLTKPTAYIFTLPFLIWLLASQIRNLSINKVILLGLIPILVMIINGSHYYRSYKLVGSPLGQTTEVGNYSYANEIIKPNLVISNLVRNVGLHLETGTKLDNKFEKIISKIHEYIITNINDPKISWPEYGFKIQGLMHHEDYAGNFLHVLLIILGLGLYLIFLNKNKTISLYILCTLGAYLIFCSYLRWQPWHSRLHLPLFILSTPFLGVVIEKFQYYKIKDVIVIKFPYVVKTFPLLTNLFAKLELIRIGNIMLCASILWSISFLITSLNKPLYGPKSVIITQREDQYFTGNNIIKKSYQEVANYLKNSKCNSVGLLGFGNDWEYALWVLINGNTSEKKRIEHIEVTNASLNSYNDEKINSTYSNLCAFIVPAWATTNPVILRGKSFYIVLKNEALKIYMPK
ncbi:MAG: glycosyltransferase family 39 protein [Burkholderiaceae bacterium]|nr:glycosyltransferase family 39 protein [Burkholderiaceae bacterium]